MKYILCLFLASCHSKPYYSLEYLRKKHKYDEQEKEKRKTNQENTKSTSNSNDTNNIKPAENLHQNNPTAAKVVHNTYDNNHSSEKHNTETNVRSTEKTKIVSVQKENMIEKPEQQSIQDHGKTTSQQSSGKALPSHPDKALPSRNPINTQVKSATTSSVTNYLYQRNHKKIKLNKNTKAFQTFIPLQTITPFVQQILFLCKQSIEITSLFIVLLLNFAAYRKLHINTHDLVTVKAHSANQLALNSLYTSDNVRSEAIRLITNNSTESAKMAIFTGPSGTGKNTLIHAMAEYSGITLFTVSCEQLTNKYLGGAADNIMQLQKQLKKIISKNKKAILYLSSIDVFLYTKTAHNHEDSERSFKALNSMINFFYTNYKNLIIVTTLDDISKYSQAVSITNLFPKQINLNLPSDTDRITYIKQQLCKAYPTVSHLEHTIQHYQEQLQHATISFSYTLLQTALDEFITEYTAPIASENLITKLIGKLKSFFLSHLQIQYSNILPNQLSLLDNPKADKKAFDHLFYSNAFKEKLIDTSHFLNQTDAKIRSLQTKKSVLLYGPPGTGKTSLAKALALYSGRVFIPFRADKMFDTRYIEQFFQLCMELSKVKSIMIFIDECESFGMSRDCNPYAASLSIALPHLEELKKPEYNIIIIYATNLKDKLDEAFINRIDFPLFIDKPDNAMILQMIKYHIAQNSQNLDPEIQKEHFENIASRMYEKSLTGRDVNKITIEAIIQWYTQSHTTSEQFLTILDEIVNTYKAQQTT